MKAKSCERWVPVIGYESLYRISDLGRVMSMGRNTVKSNGVKATYKQKMMNPCLSREGGYYIVGLTKEKILNMKKVHRVAYESFHGKVRPECDIDHIDGDKLNNMLVNLQSISKSANIKKSYLQGAMRNPHGCVGVAFYSNCKLYTAYVYINKKRVHLGYFKNLDDAIRARKKAEVETNYHDYLWT